MVYTLAFDVTVKQKFGPRTDLGCSWGIIFHTQNIFKKTYIG